MLARLTEILSNPDLIPLGTGPDAPVAIKRSSDGRPASEVEAERNRSQVSGARGAGGQRLSPEEQEVVEELKQRDAEVRAHEQAHMAAAGDLAKGGPRYEYQIGPDGKPYAVGGEVRIDTSPVPGDPEATAAKADQIRAAALAVKDPSAADLSAAQDAGRMQAEAHQDMQAVHSAELRGEAPGTQRGDSDSADPRYELRLYA